MLTDLLAQRRTAADAVADAELRLQQALEHLAAADAALAGAQQTA